MTDSVNAPAPKKSNKTLFVIIAIIVLLGIDHYKFHYISGSDVVVTDSTIVVSPTIDSTTNVVAPIDTAKKDTTKK